MFPFKLDEVEIAAGIAVRIVAAHLWASLVNRTAPFTLVKEHAHRFVNAIFAMPQHAHRFAFVRDCFGEFVTRHFYWNRVMLRQSRDIARLGFDVVIATAIARTLTAIKRILRGHDVRIPKISVTMLMDCRRAIIIPGLDCEILNRVL